MYESLEIVGSDFHIFLFSEDFLVHSILDKLHYENLTVIQLSEISNDLINTEKSKRSQAEFIWMLTPFIIEYIMKKFFLTNVTYIDADLFFFSKPDEEIKRVLLENFSTYVIEHRFPKEIETKSIMVSGRFCVQFNIFNLNNPETQAILATWKDNCILSTSYRFNGVNGEQKYLDEWPVIYKSIQVSNHHGFGLAPWNFINYSFSVIDNKIYITEKNNSSTHKLVFFHFQNIKFLPFGFINTNLSSYNKFMIKEIYTPYIKKLRNIRLMLFRDFGFNEYTYNLLTSNVIMKYFRQYLLIFRPRNFRTIIRVK